jgi:tRNA (guanine-N7-)-methyltransferase
MRKKPNLLPRLERVKPLLVQSPGLLKGGWAERFGGFNAIFLELGCGKGRFTADFAAQNPDTLLIAVERVAEALLVALERVFDRGLENVRFLAADAAALPSFFARDEVSRILINFCDPWPKRRDHKRRLTAPQFLEIYESLLPPGGELWFKTDNRDLFEWSLKRLAERGWRISELSRGLHENGVNGVMTDYEAKFHELGMPINRVTAVRPEIGEQRETSSRCSKIK